MTAFPVLNEDQVRRRLPIPQLIDAMREALVAFSSGQVVQPVRTVMSCGDGTIGGATPMLFGLMPCFVPSLPAMGAKLVTVCEANTERGLGTHQALIVMFDPVTGVPSAVLDGRYITEVRTAAVSAVSVRLLARPDSRRVAIIGSGVQARSHVEALRAIGGDFPDVGFPDIRAWSPNPDRLRRFTRESGVRQAESAEAAVRGADIIVTATPAAVPVLRDEWVSPGAHVIAVGSCVPTKRELDPALVVRSRLFVDSRAAALKEAGDIVLGIAEGRWTAGHIEAELGELPSRKSAGEITIFKSLGLAVEDVFAAHLVLRQTN